MNLPDGTGLLVLERITRLDVTLPIVVLTGFTDEHFGVSAVGAGAQDYLVRAAWNRRCCSAPRCTRSNANAPN